MRWLWISLCACSGTPSASPRDMAPNPALVREPDYATGAPDWSLSQERRCPKLPAGDKRWNPLAAPLDVDRLDDGLLICHAGIARKDDPDHWPWGSWHPATAAGKPVAGGDWDTFNGPDTRWRFRFGAREPIELWGPEDHWEMYITMPRVTLMRGDIIRVDVWDRDVSTSEYINGWETPFDGHFPLSLEAKWVRLECRPWTSSQAHQQAAPLMKEIDGYLDAIDAVEPSLNDPDLRKPRQIADLKSPWFSPNMRYLAGHIGWDAPEVQSRLERLRKSELAWTQKYQALLAKIPPADWTPLDDGLEARAVLLPSDAQHGGQADVEVRRTRPDAKLPVSEGRRLGRFEVTALEDDNTNSAQIEPGNSDHFRVFSLTPRTRALRLWAPNRVVVLAIRK